MNNLVSKKDQQGHTISYIATGIATKIDCLIKSTWEVVLKAADICGDEL